MASLVPYNGLSVLSLAVGEGGAGGIAINDDFITLATRIGQCNYSATRDPRPTDNMSVLETSGGPFTQGSRWINTSTNSEFVCVASSLSVATWDKTTLLSSPSIGTINIAMPDTSTPAVNIQAAASATAFSLVINDSTGSPRLGMATADSTLYVFAAANAHYLGLQPANLEFSNPGSNYFSALGAGGTFIFQTQNSAATGLQNRLQLTAGDLCTLYLTATTFNQSFTNVATTGNQVGMGIYPTYDQTSGSAANTDLLIYRTETAVGSGSQLMIDCQVGGGSVFNVDNGGNLNLNGNTIISGGFGTFGVDDSGEGVPILSYNFSTDTFLHVGTPLSADWGLLVGQSTTAYTGTTIPTASLGISRVAPASAVTGVILQEGTAPGQIVWVVNESTNSITFAASGTSHVADGATSPILGSTARQFVWDTHTTLWYRTG